MAHLELGWWFPIFFKCSSRNLGKIPSLTNIFQMGWFNHQLGKKLPFFKASICQALTSLSLGRCGGLVDPG